MKEEQENRDSERRLATVMFADISGFTAMSEKMDPEEVTCTMNDCFCMMGECIAKHGGTIDKFIGDCVMALFGVPKALEDTPQKAVNTAIELRNCLQKFNKEKNLAIPLNLHIGINTGPVLAGMVGSDKKQDYTVMGDTVNLASRLEDASQVGQILVGPSTYEATREGFRYKTLEPIALKGKAEPVAVYELLSVRETLARVQRGADRMISSVMVGRESELNKLELQVMKAVNGEGSIVNVIGEAGIGKSRLISELKNRDVMKRVTLREGRAISMGANLGYHLIIDILKNWTEISDDDNAATAFRKLESAIRDVCRKDSNEVFPFVATLMGMKLSGRHAERVRGIEGEALEKLILKNVRDLIIKSTEKIPLVIILEDLHWADMSSIELLESLFRLAETQRVVFVNIFRPGYKETGERIVETINEKLSTYYVEINLEPLTEEMSETLIDNMLDIKGLSHGIKNKIIQRAGGNPFFIEEVVRSFIDEGAVIVKDDGFEVTEKIETMVIPHTINDVLMARIDRLEDETRNLIKVASVIGRNFFYKILAEVARTIEDIDNRLEYLKEIQLIKERRRMEELEYLFKHALAQEAAYESILIQKRKDIHRNVADSIEKIFTERLHEFYGILSYHYINAEDWDKAEEYILKAGEEALKSSASSEALHYYQRAIELYITKHGDDVDNSILAEMEENIAHAFLNKGFFVDAVDYFDRAAIHRGEKIHSNLFFIIPKLALNLISILLHLYLPSIRKKKIPADEDDSMMQKTFKNASALIVVDIKRCLLENMEAVTQAFKYDISKSQACFNILAGGGALFIMGGISLRIARKFLDYLWENVAREPPNVLLYVYRTTELFYNSHTGNWRREIDEGSVNEALRAGDFMMATSQLLYLGYEKIELGNFTGCQTIIEKLHRIYEEYNFEHAGSDVFLLKSKSSMKKRELYDAQTYADQSVMQANKTRWPGRAVECLGIKARIEILSENFDGARETIEEAEKLVRQVGRESMLIDWYCAHVMGMFLYNLTMLEKAILMDEPDDVKKFRKATLGSGKVTLSYTRKKVATERTESFRLMGTYYWLINNQKKALTWWKSSIKEGERLGAKIELSRTYFEVGKRLLETNSKYKELNGITAEDYLEKAKGMFEKMDLQWDLDELEKVRAYRYH
jgi:class 3 adenylate cyclase/tetratricopeptide (TPR) repeat protein